MVSSIYILAVVFLVSTSVLYLLWHCRMSRARRSEQRRLEEEDTIAEEAAFSTLAGIPNAYLSCGAPALLINALPTHVFTSARRGCGQQVRRLERGGTVVACLLLDIGW
jgi:hypothetical protein